MCPKCGLSNHSHFVADPLQRRHNWQVSKGEEDAGKKRYAESKQKVQQPRIGNTVSFVGLEIGQGQDLEQIRILLASKNS